MLAIILLGDYGIQTFISEDAALIAPVRRLWHNGSKIN